MTAQLPKAQLGKNGPLVDRLGYGAMGLSLGYQDTQPDEERFKVLDAVYDNGSRFWDSAAVYADSENLIGAWLKRNPGKRNDIFLATKFGFNFTEKGEMFVDSSPEYCRKQAEASLQRLGVDHIDLYYAHRLDGKTPVEKTVAELKKLKDEGKIKYIGLSEVSSESLRRAYKVVPIDAVQIEYSLFSLDIENPQIGLLRTCRELGVAVIAYSPLGRGMLSGKIRSPDDLDANDSRRSMPRFSPENFPTNLELVHKVGELAKAKGVTTSQIALAWLLAQGHDIFPIPGTVNRSRIVENLEAAHIQLSAQEEKVLRDIAESTEVRGNRYNEFYTKDLFADTPALE